MNFEVKPSLLKPSIYGYELHQEDCFGCGKKNPLGLKADFTFIPELEQVQFPYTLQREYNGAPGFGHGGILSALLDETMGALCFHIGLIVMTNEMSFRFKKATPVEVPVLCHAWFLGKSRKKLYLECKLTDLKGEVLFVEGKGSFHIITPQIFLRKLDGRAKSEFYEQLAVNYQARESIWDRLKVIEE